MSEETLKPGDVVIVTSRSHYTRHDSWGRVTRVTEKGTIFVKVHNEERKFRPSQIGSWSNGVRKATEREIAYRKWLHARPKTAFFHVRAGLGSDNPHDVTAYKALNTSAEMRQAAKDLEELATWWDANPEARSERIP